MTVESKIEGIRFSRAEPASIKELAKILKVDESTINEALASLGTSLSSRGIVLVRTERDVTLGTHPELGELLEAIRKEELNKELTKASLETLSVILYKNDATRSDIDYIRGVNSSFILRNLEVRGLVDKKTDPNDARRYLYSPTLYTLAYLGIKSAIELPNFGKYSKILIEKGLELQTETE